MPKRKERDSEPVEAELPLAKYLASTEKRIRDRAIRSLSAFLLRSAQQDGLAMSSLELAKLWKGIFYCFWMSDKPLVQQALAQELADLVLQVAGQSADAEASLDEDKAKARALTALDFYRGFWTTMHAEWLGIDKFRVNKYYLLMRRVLHAGLVLLQTHAWDEALVHRFVTVMRGRDGPLASNNVQVPDSITYHICDLFMDELESVAVAEEGTIPIHALLVPFLELAATSESKRIYERVMSRVVLPFLEATKEKAAGHESAFPVLLEHVVDVRAGADADEEEEEEEDEGVDGAQAAIVRLRRRVLKSAFAIASGSDTYAPSRRKLYALWEAEARE